MRTPADAAASAAILNQIEMPGGVDIVTQQLVEARRKDPKVRLWPEVNLDIIGEDHIRLRPSSMTFGTAFHEFGALLMPAKMLVASQFELQYNVPWGTECGTLCRGSQGDRDRFPALRSRGSDIQKRCKDWSVDKPWRKKEKWASQN